MKIDFSGKVVLVTGSTSGIGKQIAKRFSEFGANVVITGRNQKNVTTVSDECYMLSPKKLKPLEVVADITDEEDASRLIKSTINHFGKLNVLVNNAGFCQVTSLLDPGCLANYDKVQRLDVRATVHLTLLAVPYLKKTKGNIVNISSICALKPVIPFFGYCMAKAAIDAFTRCSALELGSEGIRVNAINSGGVKSEFLSSIGLTPQQVAQQEESLRVSSPLGLYGQPEDIADLVSYVASDYAKFMSGSCLVIDGGSLFNFMKIEN